MESGRRKNLDDPFCYESGLEQCVVPISGNQQLDLKFKYMVQHSVSYQLERYTLFFSFTADCYNDSEEKCVIPFEYDGNEYYSCVSLDGWDHWCSEHYTFHTLQWGYCSDKKCRELSHPVPGTDEWVSHTFFGD